jgi:adenylate cyclase
MQGARHAGAGTSTRAPGLVAQGLPEIRMRVGIHSCVAVIGNLGSDDRFDYTAIGDGVNLAARLEGVNKLYGTGILVSGETVAKLDGAIPMRLIDRVIVKGKSEPVDIYTPCTDAAVRELTEKANAAYRARGWTESLALWKGAADAQPGRRHRRALPRTHCDAALGRTRARLDGSDRAGEALAP